MPKKLPVALRHAPIAEAICELRIAGPIPLHMIVPGMLMEKDPEAVRNVMPLPAASIPDAILASDPNLAYAALTRFQWRDLTILVGSRVLTISHTPPYMGWDNFKKRIIELFESVLNSNISPIIERYSLKYQNIFQFGQEPDPSVVLDMTLRIGGLEPRPQATFVRFETVDPDLVTIVQIAESATLQWQGDSPLQGLLIDVDTISTHESMPFPHFLNSMSDCLDKARIVNKRIFFECLRDDAISALGPTYED